MILVLLSSDVLIPHKEFNLLKLLGIMREKNAQNMDQLSHGIRIPTGYRIRADLID